MTENAIIIQQKLDLTQENRILRSRLEEQDALIAELTEKLEEREAHCATLRRQRDKYINLCKSQSSREFLTKVFHVCVSAFLIALTIYSMNTIALLVMRFCAFH